jgi:hypothetical protein
MTDDDLLKQLGRRAREQEAEAAPPDEGTFDQRAEDAAVAAILGEKKPAEKPAKVIRPQRWAMIAAPLAAAAAVALFVATRGGGGLPTYELAVSGDKAFRAPTNAPASGETILDPAGDFELVARPAVATTNVTVKASLERNGVMSEWTRARPEISNDGAVRIVGKNADLFPETTGEYVIKIAVARSGDERGISTRVRFVEKK